MSAVWLLPKKWTRIFELLVQSNDKEPSVSDWLNGLQGNSATGPTCVTYHVSHEFKTSLASVGLFFPLFATGNSFMECVASLCYTLWVFPLRNALQRDTGESSCIETEFNISLFSPSQAAITSSSPCDRMATKRQSRSVWSSAATKKI